MNEVKELEYYYIYIRRKHNDFFTNYILYVKNHEYYIDSDDEAVPLDPLLYPLFSKTIEKWYDEIPFNFSNTSDHDLTRDSKINKFKFSSIKLDILDFNFIGRNNPEYRLIFDCIDIENFAVIPCETNPFPKIYLEFYGVGRKDILEICQKINEIAKIIHVTLKAIPIQFYSQLLSITNNAIIRAESLIGAKYWNKKGKVKSYSKDELLKKYPNIGGFLYYENYIYENEMLRVLKDSELEFFNNV